MDKKPHTKKTIVKIKVITLGLNLSYIFFEFGRKIAITNDTIRKPQVRILGNFVSILVNAINSAISGVLNAP